MRIILNNGIELTPIMVTGGRIDFQGANRDSLTFVFAETGLDFLDEIFTKENCESITLIEDETGDMYIHKGYVIRTELNKKVLVTTQAGVDTPEITENRVLITMAQRTYAETEMMKLKEEVLMTQLATAELAESMMEV